MKNPLSVEESIERVASMLHGAVRPEMFLLKDGTLIARLTVDPDIAWKALSDERPAKPTCEHCDGKLVDATTFDDDRRQLLCADCGGTTIGEEI